MTASAAAVGIDILFLFSISAGLVLGVLATVQRWGSLDLASLVVRQRASNDEARYLLLQGDAREKVGLEPPNPHEVGTK